MQRAQRIPMQLKIDTAQYVGIADVRLSVWLR